MPEVPANDASGPISLVLAAIVMASAGFLGWWQWRDLRKRSAELSPLDRNHFFRQDIRRFVGTIVLALLSVAIGFGGRMPHQVNGLANSKFIYLWSGVIFLIAALLILALFDWIATQLYLRRHRLRLTQEGLSIVEAELRIKLAQHRRQRESLEGKANGHPHPPAED
jgi:hypothetical protein